ncbi:hypothetical protein K7432_010900 [Basidiobolus ranarum]|uniref:Uncharacterized protein n=1 Tax=Basidiobolus ranarum TaxID=34480 RepID=A0ABR2WMZ7_9FUNG
MRIFSFLSVLGFTIFSGPLVSSTPVSAHSLRGKHSYGRSSRYTDYPENYAAWVPDDGGWLYREHTHKPNLRHRVKLGPKKGPSSTLGADDNLASTDITSTNEVADNPEASTTANPAETPKEPGQCEHIVEGLIEFGIRADAMVCLDTKLTIDFLKSQGISPPTSQVNGLISSEDLDLVATKCDFIKANAEKLNITIEAVVCLPNLIQIMLV